MISVLFYLITGFMDPEKGPPPDHSRGDYLQRGSEISDYPPAAYRGEKMIYGLSCLHVNGIKKCAYNPNF